MIHRYCYLTTARFVLFSMLITIVHQPKADIVARNLEIARCTENELSTWDDGKDRKVSAAGLTFVYRHEGAPATLPQALVLERIKKSAKAWSLCGIPSKLELVTTSFRASPEKILIRWEASDGFGYFGLSDLAQHQLSLGVRAFDMLNQRNPYNDHLETLQMVLSHEMGHFYGLMAHSRRCVDVMSYYHDGRGGECLTKNPHLLKKFPEYRSSLPTACDIQRCKRLNGR